MLNEWDPRRARGGRPWARITAHVRAHGGDTCHICGQWINKGLAAPHPMSFSVDHLVPLADGGHPTDLANLAPAHYGCNSRRGARPLGQAQDGERANATSVDW